MGLERIFKDAICRYFKELEPADVSIFKEPKPIDLEVIKKLAMFSIGKNPLIALKVKFDEENEYTLLFKKDFEFDSELLVSDPDFFNSLPHKNLDKIGKITPSEGNKIPLYVSCVEVIEVSGCGLPAPARCLIFFVAIPEGKPTYIIGRKLLHLWEPRGIFYMNFISDILP